mgnify:CR=1 FL=1
MTQPLIQLDDIRLTLGQGAARTEILRGISLSIEEGETVAVLGASAVALQAYYLLDTREGGFATISEGYSP